MLLKGLVKSSAKVLEPAFRNSFTIRSGPPDFPFFNIFIPSLISLQVKGASRM
jgi:hypothetical protein